MSDLRDYNSSQWWFKELEGIWNADLGSAITHDMKRAAKVAINMVKEVEALHLKNTEAWREDYREVPIEQPAIGVISSFNKWDRALTEKEISYLFSGKVRPEDIPQEVQKEGDMRISEASEIRKWADRYYSLWCFVENSLPRDASSDTFDIFRGYARQVNDEIYGVTDKAKEPHAAERALWKAQREAGTNEVWITAFAKNGAACEIPVHIEPGWHDGQVYYVKPMKLTAKIVRNIPMTFREYETRLHDWEFFGTREEYIAECEKYGYFVTGKIKEVGQVKPKTVKYYFALFKTPDGRVGAESHQDKQRLRDWLITCCYTIIGDIETREVEV